MGMVDVVDDNRDAMVWRWGRQQAATPQAVDSYRGGKVKSATDK